MEKILIGDCLIKLKELEDNSVDSIVTDPPYELGFMGKKWDNSGIAYNVDMWKECLRVLKPGGHLLSFGGTRTYHRMAVAIEDAGFEVRDMIEWVYGSGMSKCNVWGKGKVRTSKSLNAENDLMVENGWEGWGKGGLKPAHEPIAFCRKPIEKRLTVAENVLKYGTGGINIDESRVISYTTAYNDGDNNDCTLQVHTVLEIRHKICSQPPFSLSESLELFRLSSDDEYGQKWYKQRDYSDDCSSCRRLYDALLPLFLKGDQVSVQQLHDVLADIDRLRIEQKHTLSSQDTDHPSSLDDFYQLILSYLNDTTLILKKQEKIILNLNKKGEQLFNEGDVKKARWSGDSEERIGRFPANLIHDNSEEVSECFPDTKSQGHWSKTKTTGFGEFGNGSSEYLGVGEKDKENGNASRFFKSIVYVPKASKSERNKGCEGLEEKEWDFNTMGTQTDEAILARGRNPENQNKLMKNNHPTVKPIALMEYLIKMVTPKGGIVLDPFAGSGSTLVAAKQNGFQYIGIEMTPEYIPIIEARLEAVKKENTLFND